MQKEIFFLSHNGVGVSFCIENGLIDQISLSICNDCNEISLPQKSPYIRFFEKIFNYLDEKIVDFKEDWNFLNVKKLTDFQLRVYNILVNVRYGNFITYEAIAERLGNKNLKRAIGRILGLNPYPIVIPCHRVLPKNFSLKDIGGFSAGKEIKEKLLKIEKIV